MQQYTGIVFQPGCQNQMLLLRFSFWFREMAKIWFKSGVKKERKKNGFKRKLCKTKKEILIIFISRAKLKAVHTLCGKENNNMPALSMHLLADQIHFSGRNSFHVDQGRIEFRLLLVPVNFWRTLLSSVRE